MSKAKDSKNDDVDDREAGDFDDDLYERDAKAVYEQLLQRIGEQSPQPRLDATRRAAEMLGDPQKAYPVIHVTGTNGKTSTSRMIESLLRAHDLRTGLLTSPHLERVNERIVIDGEPISNQALVSNWNDIQPFLELADAELVENAEQPLSFFEALTVLAFAAFADAPVDVVVLEVGMGGEWDSTNVADGQVAVFTPIALDHEARLGNTVAEIAHTKSGIIKHEASVVSASQSADAIAEIEKTVAAFDATLKVEGDGFGLTSHVLAVGGQVLEVRGLAGTYPDLFLPLFGSYQAYNAALAIAAVESFIGGGTQPLNSDVVAEGLATATSPGRLQIVGIEPTILVDAAHNPHGAAALATALGEYFTFDEICVVIGVLQDKDARGIVAALAPVAERFHVTQSHSERAIDYRELAQVVREATNDNATLEFDTFEHALARAREWAGKAPRRAVVVTGSITLVGEAITLAKTERWKQ